jgi:hypothetical protein
MSMSKFKDSDKGLNVPKFYHSLTYSKGEKWRKWMTLFSSAFGQHPMSLRMLGADETYEKLVVQFTRSQYAIYHTLSLNFLTHQRQIIEEHSPIELKRTMMQKDNWPQDDEHITFLPFGLLFLRAMANKYEDSGVTDALHKYESYTLAKPLKPGIVSVWISNLLHAWTTWHNSIKDPEFMAAVEILQQVINVTIPTGRPRIPSKRPRPLP